MKADSRPSHFWDQFCGQNAAAVFGQFFFRIDLLNHAGFLHMKKFAFRPALEKYWGSFPKDKLSVRNTRWHLHWRLLPTGAKKRIEMFGKFCVGCWLCVKLGCMQAYAFDMNVVLYNDPLSKNIVHFICLCKFRYKFCGGFRIASWTPSGFSLTRFSTQFALRVSKCLLVPYHEKDSKRTYATFNSLLWNSWQPETWPPFWYYADSYSTCGTPALPISGRDLTFLLTCDVKPKDMYWIHCISRLNIIGLEL